MLNRDEAVERLKVIGDRQDRFGHPDSESAPHLLYVIASLLAADKPKARLRTDSRHRIDPENVPIAIELVAGAADNIDKALSKMKQEQHSSAKDLLVDAKSDLDHILDIYVADSND